MMLYQLTSLLREQKSCKISNEIMSGKRERENKDLFGIGSESLSCEIIFLFPSQVKQPGLYYHSWLEQDSSTPTPPHFYRYLRFLSRPYTSL